MRRKDDKDFVELYKEYAHIATKMDQGRQDLFNSGSRPGAIFPIDYHKEAIRREMKDFINREFVMLFKPDEA